MMENSALGGERAGPQSRSGDETGNGFAPAGRWLSFMQRTAMLGLLSLAWSGIAGAGELPAQYFRLVEAGIGKVEKRLNDNPDASMPKLQALPGFNRWARLPGTILAPAVLYTKQHPANRHYHDPKMLVLAIRIGDQVALETDGKDWQDVLASEWDLCLWIETYKLLGPDLGNDRRERWKHAIEKHVAPYAADAALRVDFPYYATPYIGTSPNHFSSWAAILVIAGQTFDRKDWSVLGARILHRFAVEEQAPDGYWGEQSRSGPTTGYNQVTTNQMALYWEYTHDPAALQALRKATDFHKYFTYPDGKPVETINDRNRHWSVNLWGHFGFSNFPDGRRLAEFLTSFYREDDLTMDDVCRLSENLLYYHEGPTAPIPLDAPRYQHEMTIPAGIRKTGPWVVGLSGVMSTQAVTQQYYLDRQAHVSVFHEKTGLIITGANSKRQPELATFFETLQGQTIHLPISTRLQMGDREDRLALAYNTFFSELHVPAPAEKELVLRFVITGRGEPADVTQLNLQLVLKQGETLETATGKKYVLGRERIELSPEDIGGSIRHHGWTMKVDPTARMIWPFFPYNPYADGPETTLEQAVAVLSVPLRKKKTTEDWYVRPAEQEISIVLEVE